MKATDFHYVFVKQLTLSRVTGFWTDLSRASGPATRLRITTIVLNLNVPRFFVYSVQTRRTVFLDPGSLKYEKSDSDLFSVYHVTSFYG